jgi:hypothetical protein
MRLPYVLFVIGMLDAPQIDYDKKQDTIYKPKNAQDELKSLAGFLN